MNIKGNGVEKEQKDIVESIVLKQLNLRTDSWQKIREILYEAVYLDQSRLREDSFEKIVLYLGIMIHRNQQGWDLFRRCRRLPESDGTKKSNASDFLPEDQRIYGKKKYSA